MNIMLMVYLKKLSIVWENAIKKLEKGGAKSKKNFITSYKYALPTYYIIAPAEASSNLARYDGVKYGFRSENKNSSLMKCMK